ncbi:MAG: hypothetical protein MZV63_63465 [Marinilabiliales bacterium]|nr:hypothetical protein [Marinilabiliales bacterium]
MITLLVGRSPRHRKDVRNRRCRCPGVRPDRYSAGTLTRKRLFSMTQNDRWGMNAIVTCTKSAANPDAVTLYYLSDLALREWNIPESARTAIEKAKTPGYIFATRRDRELSVFVEAGTNRRHDRNSADQGIRY